MTIGDQQPADGPAAAPERDAAVLQAENAAVQAENAALRQQLLELQAKARPESTTTTQMCQADA